MSFYLIGRLGPQWRPACSCLPLVRGRVFIVVLLVMMLFIVILIGQGYCRRHVKTDPGVAPEF